MLKRVPLYPLLFSLFPILSLTAYNLGEILLEAAFRPLLVALLVGTALLGLAGWILRDGHRAALAVFVVLVLFFSYGQVYNTLEDVTVGNVSIFRHRTLLPFCGVLLLAALYWTLRRLEQPAAFTPGLNLLTIFLLIYPTSSIVLNVLQQESANRSVHAAPSQVVAQGDRPDIYYIILDGYGREDVFQELLGFDNSEFLDALRQRGFYVADCSQSNYAYTEFSLTSALNYDYVENLGHSERKALLKQSATRSFFEANGYKIVAFPTGWAFTEWTDADLYLDFEHPVTALTEFETLILDTTALRAVSDFRSPKPADASQKDLRRLRVFSLLENIQKLPKSDEDLFVFAHLVVPHFPYSFGPNGEVPAFQGKDNTYEESVAAYIDQVKFVNGETLKVVDALLRDSKVPPIILIQGDHGPLPDLTRDPAQRMPILNAYYLPGMQADEVLYPSITPVNSFRVVLSFYFGQDLPLLEDASYFAPLKDRNEYQRVPNTCIDRP